MTDLLKTVEDFKTALQAQADAFREAGERIRGIREEMLRNNGPRGELLHRLNQTWKHHRDPGRPINWRGL
jgi:hypothetical protein